jgi:hypothetical protein
MLIDDYVNWRLEKGENWLQMKVRLAEELGDFTRSLADR